VKKKYFNMICTIGLIALLTETLFPIVWLLLTSFKTNILALEIPPRLIFTPTFSNYPEVIVQNRDFLRYYLNSIITAVLSTLTVLFLAVPAAYVLARYRFKGKVSLAFFILSTRMIPQVAIGIPLYMIIMNLNMLDTYFALIASFIAFNLPFGIWMMMGFIRTIPREIEEAGEIDGCNKFSVFYRVVLPLTGPGLAAVGILVLIVCWKEFFLPLVLTSSPSAKTLSVVAGQFITEYGINWGQMSAFSILTFLPVFALAVYAQRYLVSGLTMGAVKS
jgi:multiple sugar transport system permease protein